MLMGLSKMFNFAQVLQEVSRGTGIVEGVGFITLLTAAWKMSRMFHKGEIEVKDRISEVKQDVARIDTKLSDYIERTPTIDQCISNHTAISKEVVESNSRLEDKVTGLVLDSESTIRELDKRLRNTELWQSKHNGMDSNK